nr:hypothetical protein [Nanoarchaeum sp.]
MKVLRGDLDNTTGNVLVYSEFENLDDKQIMTISYYATTNQKLFTSKFPCLGEKTATMVKQKDSINGALKLYNPNQDIERVLIFSTGIINPDLETILDSNDDLICGGGRYLDISNADIESKLLLQYYFNRHFGRLERHKFLVENKSAPDEPTKTYKDFLGVNIQDHILNRYVDPLLRAKHKKDVLEITSVKQDLVRFGENSIFSRYIEELAEVILASGLLQRDLIREYIKLISSLHLEKYEESEIHLAKINELKM